MKEFKILQQIADTPGKNDKLKVLASCPTDEMKKLLYLTMNRFLTYRIKKVDLPKTYNTLQPDIFPELEELLLGLSKHDQGSNEAKAMIKRLLAKCTEENAQWIIRIIKRDLKIGISESSVNKVFPRLVPTFTVQLAKPMEDWDKVEFPVVVEEKLDGLRTIAIVKDGTVSFYSREGMEFTGLEAIAEEILRLFPGANFVLDGEIIGKKLNPKCKSAMKNYKAGKNWKFAQAQSMVGSASTTRADVIEYLGFYTWDLIDIDFFLDQGNSKLVGKTLLDRKFALTALFDRNKLTLVNVFLVPNVVCHTKEEVLYVFKQIRDKDGEGVMVKKIGKPYSFKRNDYILKLKEFFTFDLRIVGCYEGTVDSKYVGMLGGLTVASDCGAIKSDVGSGFTDWDRTELWLRYLNGDLIGKIAEIMFQEVTEDGSLRFPTFVQERPDKTTTSIF